MSSPGRFPSPACLLVLAALSLSAGCGRERTTWSVMLENHRDLQRAEIRLAHQYVADLQAWREAHPGAPETGRAGVEMIRIMGQLGDIAGAQRCWRELKTAVEGTPAATAAGLEMAEAALMGADAEAAGQVIADVLAGAYGYAHETRLVQNLATLLALRGQPGEAIAAYEMIREMELYAEYPARFRSLEIFRDYLERVGDEFPHLIGTAFDGTPLDTRAFRGRPLFLHFWRRRGSLNHDIAFLENLQKLHPALAVVSINVGDEPEAVRQALYRHAPRWPFWHDTDGSFADSLGITFMGLYVHEPKGILLDRAGRIAVMPGREGAIAIGLAALSDPPASSRQSRPQQGYAGDSATLETLMRDHMRALIAARDASRVSLLEALREHADRSTENSEKARACLEMMRTAAAAGAIDRAGEAWSLWGGIGEARTGGESPPARERYAGAMAFARARAMLTCGDAERTRSLVYEAVGERREREDLYLLCDLAAALSVLGDVAGARQAYQKIIDITGGAGAAAWEGYIAALDRVGQPLETFTLPGLNGGTVSPERFAGRLLLIDFWGSWCHACIREMPHVYEAWNRYHEHGFEVLGIVVRDTREKARAFLERTGYPWDQAFDADSSVAARQVVVGYPTTILVDGSGRVRCTRTFGGGLEIALRLLMGP